MAGAEPVYVPATADTNYLPDYAALPEAVLRRTALAFYNTPANPQGSVATLEQLVTVIELARRHDFVLASDECYSEIYDAAPPAGAMQACARLGGSLDHVLVFHSLSKRSGVPGLRCGFVAGDAEVIAAFTHLRSYGGATLPLPILAAGAALWRDEAHVEENRAGYRAKNDAAERLLGGRFGFQRPPGGFFLWLDVGDGEAAAVKLWREARLRVLPGRYLARDEADGGNPGARYIRVALVHDLETTERALGRLADIL
jgi:N-succinyldiaminopimelate aminotransferase